MQWIRENPSAALGVLVVLVGLIGIGWQDVVRFRLRRVMAVASVSFRQSIRRRVLWLTPLVILGIVIVSQLQRALDAQDAIRQTTTYCLFATGLLMVLVTIILACTNLPKEIENRVIYTIATKPVTRLEIILGKVIGFSGVTLSILLIMGVFTWTYLHFQDWRARRAIAQQLEAGAFEPVSKPTLEYYRDQGTLHARKLAVPGTLEVFAHLPTSAVDRWAAPAGEGEIYARFALDRSQLGPPSPNSEYAGGVAIRLRVNTREVPVARRLYGPDPTTPAGTPASTPAATQPTTQASAGAASTPATTQPTAQATTQPVFKPRVFLNLYNLNRETLVYSGEMMIPPKEPGGKMEPASNGFELPESGEIVAVVKPESLDRIVAYGGPPTEFYVNITGAPEMEDREIQVLESDIILYSPQTQKAWGPEQIEYSGRMGQYGQQVRGRPEGTDRVGMYGFYRVELPAGKDQFTFELRPGVEADRTEVDEDDVLTRVDVEFYKLHAEGGGPDLSQKLGPVTIYPESQRPTYFQVPAAWLGEGNFAAVLRVKSRSFLGLRGGQAASLKLVVSDQPFGLNLMKSLTVLWLMSVLVIIVSIFCSTFVSWPIAFVLTLVILGGHWMANQLGDLARPGVGRDLFTQLVGEGSAGVSRAFSETMDALIGMLNVLKTVLPDISKFSALQDIERGVAIAPAEVLLPSLVVTLGFGIPLMVLSYVFLKYKEVAP